jgi:hypothetical protein
MRVHYGFWLKGVEGWSGNAAHDGLVEGRVGALDQVVVDLLLRVIERGCIMVLFLVGRVLKRNLDGLAVLAEDLTR